MSLLVDSKVWSLALRRDAAYASEKNGRLRFKEAAERSAITGDRRARAIASPFVIARRR